MAYYLGIDIGSGTSKGVLLQNGTVIASHSLRSGVNYKQAVQKLYEELLAKANVAVKDIAGITATGQGAGMVEYADRQIADTRCCARGMKRIFPGVRTVIDVEGQSTQVLRLNERGQVVNFIISERCASGAGRFIYKISNFLQIPLYDICALY